MKRLLVSAFLLLGSVGVARAQVSAPTLNVDRGNVAQDFSATSAAKATLLSDLAAADTFSPPAAKPANTFAAPVAATALALPLDNAEPASPSPQPRFLYGGRDDYRWQLGIGASWLRFQSSAFNANAIGINTSVVYFTNDWFGIEGEITAVFAPKIFDREHVKIATYGAGPKIAWRQKQWEPWLHGIFGGAHEQPQVAGQSRNSYAIKAGGGADYRWNPRVSFRLEADYVRTGFFSESQNDFQIAGGIVFHF
jgi:opacity protein-like surface antigen